MKPASTERESLQLSPDRLDYLLRRARYSCESSGILIYGDAPQEECKAKLQSLQKKHLCVGWTIVSLGVEVPLFPVIYSVFVMRIHAVQGESSDARLYFCWCDCRTASPVDVPIHPTEYHSISQNVGDRTEDLRAELSRNRWFQTPVSFVHNHQVRAVYT